MKFIRFLPLLTSVISGILLEIFFFWHKAIYVSGVLILLLFFFTFTQLTKAGARDEKWWNLLILPSCFSMSLIFFSTMAANNILIHFLFIFHIIFIYIYTRAAYNFLLKTGSNRIFVIENISAYGNFITFFFISSAIYGLQAFLNIAVWQLMIIILLTTALIVYQVIWANNIDWRQGFFYILIFCLVLAEISWSISFLPLSFYILGMVLAMCYYMLMGLTRFYLLGKLNKKLIKSYLAFGLAGIFIILLTSRWM